jgi:hypothetical protein
VVFQAQKLIRKTPPTPSCEEGEFIFSYCKKLMVESSPKHHKNKFKIIAK